MTTPFQKNGGYNERKEVEKKFSDFFSLKKTETSCRLNLNQNELKIGFVRENSQYLDS